MDSKLDMGFHCVRPTEIGNAIFTVFCTVPWSSWEEKASFANQHQVCSPHACSPKECPCWGWGEAEAISQTHGPYSTGVVKISFLLAPPSSCVLGDQFLVPPSCLCVFWPKEDSSAGKIPLVCREDWSPGFIFM